MASKVGFALFGMGNMGLLHARNTVLSPRASLNWIIRNRLEDAQKFVKDLNLNARCTTPDRLEEVYSDPEVHATLICSPSSTHNKIIQDSLHAGKAVFCEKPVTIAEDSTRKCYELAESRNLPLFCAFHRPFDPSFRNVYDRIKSGELGRVRLIKVTSRDLSLPPISYLKTSGGIIADSTVHDLNYVLWIAGSRPKTIYVQGMNFDPELASIPDMDQVLVTIKHENGTLSLIDNGRLAAYGYDQRLEVLCEEGLLSVGNRSSDHVTEAGHHVTREPRIHSHFTTRYDQAYSNELEHFLDVLEGKSELLVTKDDTIETMRLIRACKLSIETGSPVEFDEMS
ncbi:inositol 2-dehydrogenase-like [Pecten maximus]|uniref:inositol 2-dehydrogenase-like n=1 Tax=Pecten maximus TaxID=6579 RepID=UPI00145849C1|nr:inositol 2-dehydrogenase-like [Pecten maximus]XP_033760608.1 inositol 2-dehydrogenase-like [Pecten maximus]